MKVTVWDVNKPEKDLGKRCTIDISSGIPLPGDEVGLRERDYNPRIYRLSATVVRRRWVFNDNTPGEAELQLWVQLHGEGA